MFFYFITFFSVNNSAAKVQNMAGGCCDEFSIVINRNEELDLETIETAICLKIGGQNVLIRT